MARDQIENPPQHVETAPPGEIRPESSATLRYFSFGIAVAFVLPALALVIVGFGWGRVRVGLVGIALIVVLGTSYYLILWRIMKSRKIESA
jgi:hypothetical protein